MGAGDADSSSGIACWRISATGELSGRLRIGAPTDDPPGRWSVLGWADRDHITLWRRGKHNELRIVGTDAGERPADLRVVGRPVACRIAASGRVECMLALSAGGGRAVPCLYFPADDTYLLVGGPGEFTGLAAWDARQGLAVLNAEAGGSSHLRIVLYGGGSIEEVPLAPSGDIAVLSARGHGADTVGLTGRTRDGQVVPGTLNLVDASVRWHDAMIGYWSTDVSPSGRRLLISTWADERNVYRVLGTDGERIGEVRPPDGVATRLVFTADERHLVGWYQSPTTPPTVLRWDTETGTACPTRRNSPRAVSHDLSWSHRRVPDRDGRDLPEWVFTPRHGRSHGTVLHLHGGPRGRLNQIYDPVIAALASAGWTVVGMNYPGSTGYGQEYAERSRGDWGGTDAASVEWRLRTLRREACGPICVYGHSYGGYLALLLLAAAPEAVDATAVWAPVTDLPELLRTSGGTRRRWLEEELGALRSDPAQLIARSPVTRLGTLRGQRLLVGHGLLDEVCPVEQSRRLAHTLDGPRERPGRFEYLEDDGSSHTPTTWHRWIDAVVGHFDRVRSAGSRTALRDDGSAATREKPRSTNGRPALRDTRVRTIR